MSAAAIAAALIPGRLSRQASSSPISENMQVGPHTFRPLSRFRNRGRCEACYLHEDLHPVGGYVTARPLLDRRLPIAAA